MYAAPHDSRRDATRAGVTFAVHPAHPDYLIGSDGSVHNERTGRTAAPIIPITEHTLPTVMLVMLDADAEGREGARRWTVTRPLGEVVLTAHGYPRPTEGAVVLHLDGDIDNCALANMRWETTADVLHAEVRAAAAAGVALEYREVNSYPLVHMHRWAPRKESGPGGPLLVYLTFMRDGRVEKTYVQLGLLVEAAFGSGREAITLETTRGEVPASTAASSPSLSAAGGMPTEYRPAGAPAAVVYRTVPIEGLTHFIIGSDGSAHNTNTRKRIGGTITKRRNPLYYSLKMQLPQLDAESAASSAEGALQTDTDSRAETRSRRAPHQKLEKLKSAAHWVLVSFGHPQPAAHAVIRYRDGDSTNDALDNLYWQSDADVVAHAIAEDVAAREVAAAEGRIVPPPLTALHHAASDMHLFSDGRTFSVRSHTWISGERQKSGVQLDVSVAGALPGVSTRSKYRRMSRARLVWEAHHRVILTVQERVYRLDGDGHNDRIENLTLTPVRRAKSPRRSRAKKEKATK
jgi:hypothetical protein